MDKYDDNKPCAEHTEATLDMMGLGPAETEMGAQLLNSERDMTLWQACWAQWRMLCYGKHAQFEEPGCEMLKYSHRIQPLLRSLLEPASDTMASSTEHQSRCQPSPYILETPPPTDKHTCHLYGLRSGRP